MYRTGPGPRSIVLIALHGLGGVHGIELERLGGGGVRDRPGRPGGGVPVARAHPAVQAPKAEPGVADRGAALGQQLPRAAGQAGQGHRVQPQPVVHDDADHGRVQARHRQAQGQPCRRAARPDRGDHVGGCGQVTRLHLVGDLVRRLHVPERPDCGRAAGGLEIGRPAAAGVPGHQRGKRSDGPGPGVGVVQRRAAGLQALLLSADVVVDRLVDQHQRRRDPVLAAVQRGGQAPVGAHPAHGQDRPRGAPPRLGQDPLELSHLVAAPAAVAVCALVLDPDLATASDV